MRFHRWLHQKVFHEEQATRTTKIEISRLSTVDFLEFALGMLLLNIQLVAFSSILCDPHGRLHC